MKKRCLLPLVLILALPCLTALAVHDPSPYSHICSYTVPGQILTVPDCSHTGTQRMQCSYKGCSRSTQVVLPTVGHDMGGWVMDRQPTCTEAGKKHRSCRYGCGKTETAVLPAAHSWGDWATVQEASCLTDGSRLRVCQSCGVEETEAIPAPGHELVTDTAAACTTPGSAHCARCGETVALPAGAHQLHLLLPASCTAPGDQACDICGEHVTLPMTEHTWHTLRQASCHQTGQEECRVCHTLRDIPMTDHQWDDAQAQAPTCLTEGLRVCGVRGCGYTEALPALGHSWTDWQQDADGHPCRSCSRCGVLEEQASPAEEALQSLGLTLMGEDGALSFTLRLEGDVLQLRYAEPRGRLALAITPAQYQALLEHGVSRLQLPGDVRLTLRRDLAQDPRIARVTAAWGSLDAYVLMVDPVSGTAQFTLARGGELVWHEALSRELLE